MDQTVIASKIDSLYRCISRIQHKTPELKTELLEDIDLQDIIAVNLVRAVQIAVDIGTHINADSDEPTPTTMGQVFNHLEKGNIIAPRTANSMRSAVGFRNVSVHSYDTIDWEIVWAIITQHIKEFESYALEISQHCGL